MKINKILTGLLVAVLTVNQVLIMNASSAMGKGMDAKMFAMLTGAGEAQAMIVTPVVNADGVTTSLKTLPTITELPAEPKTGDIIADAMTVMIATGTPFYAPSGISFDDPVSALSAWGKYAKLELTPAMEERYKYLVGVFPCNFCCGGPTKVTINGRCGCAHANGARGFFRYMLANYGDDYTNDQLAGEAYRWQAVWYPSGVVEDYLLATGRGDVIGHKTHGGAGSDGRHGL